jgi:hypothetical protein
MTTFTQLTAGQIAAHEDLFQRLSYFGLNGCNGREVLAWAVDGATPPQRKTLLGLIEQYNKDNNTEVARPIINAVDTESSGLTTTIQAVSSWTKGEAGLITSLHTKVLVLVDCSGSMKFEHLDPKPAEQAADLIFAQLQRKDIEVTLVGFRRTLSTRGARIKNDVSLSRLREFLKASASMGTDLDEVSHFINGQKNQLSNWDWPAVKDFQDDVFTPVERQQPKENDQVVIITDCDPNPNASDDAKVFAIDSKKKKPSVLVVWQENNEDFWGKIKTAWKPSNYMKYIHRPNTAYLQKTLGEEFTEEQSEKACFLTSVKDKDTVTISHDGKYAMDAFMGRIFDERVTINVTGKDIQSIHRSGGDAYGRGEDGNFDIVVTNEVGLHIVTWNENTEQTPEKIQIRVGREGEERALEIKPAEGSRAKYWFRRCAESLISHNCLKRGVVVDFEQVKEVMGGNLDHAFLAQFVLQNITHENGQISFQEGKIPKELRSNLLQICQHYHRLTGTNGGYTDVNQKVIMEHWFPELKKEPERKQKKRSRDSVQNDGKFPKKSRWGPAQNDGKLSATAMESSQGRGRKYKIRQSHQSRT